jgi:hypothetical protein
MLISDSESHFIPVEESEVGAVYRSSAVVSIGDGESLPSCEAFVCVIKRDQRDHVFAALHVKALKRNLIYSLDSCPGNPLSSEILLKKAFAFVEAMGFSMEAVNLKYGTAMREVVLRSIPVLLAPGSIEKIQDERAAELAELERLVAEAADEKGAESLDSTSEEMKRSSEEREIAATAAARKLAMEKCADEKETAIRETVQPFILQVNVSEATAFERAERERLLRENAVFEKRASELAKTVARLTAQAEKDRDASEKRAAELEAEVAKKLEEAEVERAGRERMTRDRESAEKRVADLEKMLFQVRQEVEGEKDRGKALAQEKKSLRKQVLELEKALSEARSEKETQNQDAGALSLAEERITRLEHALCEARDVAEAERFERELLVREKAAGERRIKELEQERAGGAGVFESSGGDFENPELEKRLADVERDADRLRNQLETERTERQRLEAERIVYEKRLSEMEEALLQNGEIGAGDGQGPSESVAAVDERVAGLQRALQRAEERTEFLRLEVDRLAAAKLSAEKLLAKRAPAPQKESADPRRAETPALPGRGYTGSPPQIVRRPPPRGAFFHIDWELDCIEYASPEEIIEVHESMNMTQLSLEGYHSQHCSAWIVAVKKRETRQVFVAFGLSESGRNLIYSPAKPIRNNEDYQKALREAVKFLEVVGYIPEKMAFGKSQKEDALSRIPVLQGSQKRVQGF